MTPAEYLAKQCTKLASMRFKNEISPLMAAEQMDKYIQEALQMEKDLFKSFYTIGVMNGMASNKMDIELDIEDTFNKLYEKYTHQPHFITFNK